jgi:hypothetical protein
MVTIDLEKLTKADELRKKTDDIRKVLANRLLLKVVDICSLASSRGEYQIEFHSEMSMFQPCDAKMEREIIKALKELGFKRKDGIYITWRD